MPIKYIGRTTHFRGKGLWEILGNLKDFGVGRIVVRSRFERYPEPSYFKVSRVEAMPPSDDPYIPRKVRAWGEMVFRGRKIQGEVVLDAITYKTDYRLLHKHEEEEYCKWDKTLKPITILPQTGPFPPLLKELIIQDMVSKGKQVTEEPKMKMYYKESSFNFQRVAEDGETPSFVQELGVGKTSYPQFYENVKKE